MTRKSRLGWWMVLIPAFVLVTAGGTASNAVSSGGNTGLKAEAVPEGIRITFDNIPAETTRLFILFQNWGEKKILSGTHDIIGIHTDIRGYALNQVKRTGKVICPFVKTGQKYHIFVSVFEGDDEYEYLDPVSVEYEANKGIHLSRNLDLKLNETQTGVTLSSVPEFSAEVKYAPNKYMYSVNIDMAEKGSLGYGEEIADSLSWYFEPELSDEMTAGGYLEKGEYPAFVTAYCILNYDNLSWSVEVAKSRLFTYSH